jgi:hypothetical protein
MPRLPRAIAGSIYGAPAVGREIGRKIVVWLWPFIE